MVFETGCNLSSHLAHTGRSEEKLIMAICIFVRMLLSVLNT